MKEIKMNAETVATDGVERAYRFAVVDMYNTIGQSNEAIKWLWQDIAAEVA